MLSEVDLRLFGRILCFAVAVQFCWDTADAGLSHPVTWRSVSEDGKLVFVMISPLPIDQDIRDPFDEEEIRWIRATYPKSGLYLSVNSTQPLWEYHGPWLNPSVIIAPDGEHLIFPGGWTWDEYSHNAVMFMHRGQVLGSYYDQEIIPNWIVKAVLNGFAAPSCAGTNFDSERMTYVIRTNQGEQIVFDVTTGKVIGFHSTFATLYTVTAVGLGALVIAFIFRWRAPKRDEAA
jgi:hypothetical protein